METVSRITQKSRLLTLGSEWPIVGRTSYGGVVRAGWWLLQRLGEAQVG